MISSGQRIITGLTLVVLLLVLAAEGRPQYYETNEFDHIPPGQTFNPFYAYQVLNRYPDSQNEKLRFFLEAQQDPKDDVISGGAGDNLIREPMSKRQAVRYRQCYFNPISCFRK